VLMNAEVTSRHESSTMSAASDIKTQRAFGRS